MIQIKNNPALFILLWDGCENILLFLISNFLYIKIYEKPELRL